MEECYASKPMNSDKNYRNFHKLFKGQQRAGKLHENKMSYGGNNENW